MLFNPFTVLLNNNDEKPITTELVESEILQKHKPSFYVWSLIKFITTNCLKILKFIKTMFVQNLVYAYSYINQK